MDLVTIERATGPDDDVRALVAELEEELSAEYPPEQRHGLQLEAIFEPHVRFFVARAAGAAVGCGGVALFADHGELKRMYVRARARGTGVAPALLAQLEAETRAAGLPVWRLETRLRQGAAMRFYERCGFRTCAAFGAYACMPPSAVESSVFYEKRSAN
jgi:putative acetyltransferase